MWFVTHFGRGMSNRSVWDCFHMAGQVCCDMIRARGLDADTDGNYLHCHHKYLEQEGASTVNSPEGALAASPFQQGKQEDCVFIFANKSGPVHKVPVCG